MRLLFDLPKGVKDALALNKTEQIKYAVMYDIGADGQLCNAYLAVTDEKLVSFESSEKVFEVRLCDLDKVGCEVYTGSGALLVQVKGEKKICARFSMKHADRFSALAVSIDRLINDSAKVAKGGGERYCHKCGTPLISGYCPSCSKRHVGLERFLALCRPYMLRLILASCLMIVSSVCILFTQQIQKEVLDGYLTVPTGDLMAVVPFFAMIVVLAVINILAAVFKRIVCVNLGANMSMDLRKKVFDKIQSLSMSFISGSRAGELMNRVTTDTAAVRDFMDRCFGNMMSNVVTMVGAIIFMLAMNWKLALVTVAFAPIALVLARLFNRKIRTLFRAQSRKNDRIKTRLQDVISGIRVVKTFGRERAEADKFDKLSSDLAETNCRNETFWAVFFPLLSLAMGIGINFISYFGGIDVLNGTMTAGTLVQFTSYATLLYAPLRWLAMMPRLIMRMLNSIDRIYTVIDEIPDVVDTPEAKAHEIDGNVEFKNVSFSYNSYNTVLENVSFSVKKGEMIGIVGKSGVGKTSLINLLMRLYDVDGGSIEVDGVDIRNITTDSLHSQIGVVLQETFLFSGTVLDNIRYAKRDASYEEIVTAAKMANAHDFICMMPDGYNTYIGERGYTVSGGQRQRIAIARAILANPRLLILDEATSALDTESEELVQQAIERLTGGRTTFAIAHRLSTLRNADRIVVLDNHTVAEVGTHKELMHNKGIYYSLVTAQSKLHKIQQ